MSKSINYTISTDADKTLVTSGKLYFWERVDISISGMTVSDTSKVRAAIYDGTSQVAIATNFAQNEDDTIYCEILLQSQELQSALSSTNPNKPKTFTLYIWDESEEEMKVAGSIQIYNNPYLDDETLSNVIVNSNIKIQYSEDGITYSDNVLENTSYIRFSVDGGTTWQDGISVCSYVRSDWNESNSYSPAFILNKPTIEIPEFIHPQSDWDESNSESDSYIRNKPGLATIIKDGLMPKEDKVKAEKIIINGDGNQFLGDDGQYHVIEIPQIELVQADWEQSNSDSDSYINNKPGLATELKDGIMPKEDKIKVNKMIISEDGTKYLGNDGEYHLFKDSIYNNGVEYAVTVQGTTVSFSNGHTIYIVTPSSGDSILFNAGGIPSGSVYTCELWINLTSVFSFSLPNITYWINNEVPAFTSSGLYWLSLRYYDGYWYANLMKGV